MGSNWTKESVENVNHPWNLTSLYQKFCFMAISLLRKYRKRLPESPQREQRNKLCNQSAETTPMLRLRRVNSRRRSSPYGRKRSLSCVKRIGTRTTGSDPEEVDRRSPGRPSKRVKWKAQSGCLPVTFCLWALVFPTGTDVGSTKRFLSLCQRGKESAWSWRPIVSLFHINLVSDIRVKKFLEFIKVEGLHNIDWRPFRQIEQPLDRGQRISF